MTTIGLTANDQLLAVTLNPKVASGQQNTVDIHVEFSDDWDRFAKSAVFFTSNDTNTIYEKVLTNGECIVPAEVMSKDGVLYIGVRGVNSQNNEVKTTSLVKYKISEGSPSGTGTEVEPTPDVYQQLLTAYEKTNSAIAFERNRITNLAKLKEGSTTGDAELTDIRIGADGTVYESAGVSVRGQINRLRSDISDSLGSRYYLKDITNLLNRDICYYTDTGEISGDASSERTDLFSVNFGEEYRISGSYGYGSCLICEFDENKNFLRAVGTSDESYEIAEDYVYSPGIGVSYIGVSSRRPTGEEPYPLTVKKYVWGFNDIVADIENLDAQTVRKEEGKGLSSNDFTDEHKEKLEHIGKTYKTNIVKNFNGDNLASAVNNYLSGLQFVWVSSTTFPEDGTLKKVTLVNGLSADVETEKTLKIVIISSDLTCKSITDFSYICPMARRETFDISTNIEVNKDDYIGFVINENGQLMYNNGGLEGATLSITSSNISVGQPVTYTKTFDNTNIPFICEYLTLTDKPEIVVEQEITESSENPVSGNAVKIYVDESKKTWKGKKWACVGDSITMPNSPHNTTPYYNIIADNTGIEIFNMGVTSTGYKQREAQNEAFYQRILNIHTDCDVITILGSGNDLGKGYTLGTATDTGTDTICGCINTTLDNLYSKITSANVGIITPYPWQSYPPHTENAMKEYVAKLIEIAELRGIPYLDLYHCSGLRPWDDTARLEQFSSVWTEGGDGVHVNDFGNTLIAPKIKAFLTTLLLD